MEDMYLMQQVSAIDQVIDYISQVEREVVYLNEKVAETMSFLRQNGIRTEITNMVENVYLEHVNGEIESLLSRMKVLDVSYLNDVRDHLLRAGREQ